MKHAIANILDFFYPPFKKWMPIVTYRYAVCGSANTVLGLCIYYVFYNFIFSRENFIVGALVLKPHMASLFTSGATTVIVGFLLNRYVVFTDSYLKGRVQLFRYLLSFFFNLMLNYVLLKLFVEILHIEAFVSQLITTVIIIGVSYITQKYFTFRIKDN